MEQLSDGVYLRAVADTPGFDPIRTWGPGPLLLIKSLSPDGAAPFQFATPDDESASPIALASTDGGGMQVEQLQRGYLAEHSVVVPIRKSKRNPWSHITIGRARTNDIRLNHKSVSKVHCYVFPPLAWEIIKTEEPWRIRDCKSTNGTFVALGSGRQPVPSAGDGVAIMPGTELQIGVVQALYVDGEDLAQAVEWAKREWIRQDQAAANKKSDDTTRWPRRPSS